MARSIEFDGDNSTDLAVYVLNRGFSSTYDFCACFNRPFLLSLIRLFLKKLFFKTYSKKIFFFEFLGVFSAYFFIFHGVIRQIKRKKDVKSAGLV